METPVTQAGSRPGETAIVALCIMISVGAGLLLGTRAGREIAVPLGVVALFLLLVWDLRLVVPVLLVMLPFGPKFPMAFGNLYLSTAVLIAAYLAWAVRLPASRKGLELRYNDVLLGVAFMAAAFAISSLQNYQFLISDRTALLRFIQFLIYTGIFVMVFQMELSRSVIKFLLVLMILAGIAQGMLGAAQWMLRPGLYVTGTFDGEHNLFAAYAAFTVVLLTGVALETRRRSLTILSLAAIAIMLFAIVFSFSRTAYVSLAVSFLVFAFLPIGRTKRIVVPLTAAGAAIAGLVIVPASVTERMRDILRTATGEYIALSFRYRLRMWRIALEDFLESPILGKGAWTYKLRDNFFVKVGAEVGIVGLVAFLVLIYLILRASWRHIADPPDDGFVRGIVVGFFPAAVGSLIVFNLAGDFLSVHRFIGVFWIGLALILRYRMPSGTVADGTK
jgi:O-antigen ligase